MSVIQILASNIGLVMNHIDLALNIPSHDVNVKICFHFERCEHFLLAPSVKESLQSNGLTCRLRNCLSNCSQQYLISHNDQ